MAQRMRKTGHLAAAYFCRHNDDTRNNPRYLLGTVARQLCDCNAQYKKTIGGEIRVKMLLGNAKLGVRELFTKLLQEPLSKCSSCDQRRLVIIDALDETEYESREDFLDLIMHRFPMLPDWLVFFITSRPEDSVQFTLQKYNPCVKICAGNNGQDNFYQKHEQDIRIFLEKKLDFSRLPVTVEDILKKCDGLFLYAHYIVNEMRLSAYSGKELNPLSELFPGDIHSFFRQNFKRIYDQVGQDVFEKLFGCAIVAPAARLPVSIISYILKREKSSHNEQQVIDAVSQFVVLQTSDQTLTFLHNLIPTWLTDKNKARKFFIDKKSAQEYLSKVFAEIFRFVVNEPPTGPSIDVDLKDYVSRVGVRFLCENGAKDLLKVVFDSLTNYHFIERRMKYEKIEIYHLLEDFRVAASRFAPEEVSKQEILQEILFVIENNVPVLLECPHLLHSCIRNASNAVQETVSIPQVSTPWLEWSNYAFPFAVDANITSMHCFATAPKKRTVAGAKGRSLEFFDASTVERVSGPFDLGSDAIDDITHLEFTPDGKFLFFGRLDQWFSVDRGCVEDFPQFSGNSQIYKWGFFTRDGQCIVVKTSFSSNPRTCQNKFCLPNLLALWALKEIEQSGDDEMTVSFCPDLCNQEEPCSKAGLQIERLFERLGMREILGKGLGGGLEGHDEASGSQGYLGFCLSCRYCQKLQELTRSKQEPSLESVRKLVIDFYPCIFDYQVWDPLSGKPLLQQVFLQNTQLNPFTYWCHLSCVYSEAGMKMKCSGIEKAMSLCNIAIVIALFRFSSEFKSYLDQLMEEHLKSYLDKLMEQHLKSYLDQLMEERRKSYLDPLMEELLKSCLDKLMEERRKSCLDQLTEERRKSCLVQLMEEYRKSYIVQLVEEYWKPLLDQLMEECLKRNLDQLIEEHLKSYLDEIMAKHGGEQRGFLSELFRKVHDYAFKIGLWRNVPKGFQRLLDYVNGEIPTCVSQEVKRVIQPGDSLQVSKLQTENQGEHHIHVEKPEHTFNNFKRFTFSNDDLFFIYQSSGGSLHSLSFKTGKVLTSVSRCNLFYFTRERQVGYLFRCGSEETPILLTSLFSPFKFLSASRVKPSVVGKSVTAMFFSSNAVISVSSDSMVTLIQTLTFAGKEVITFNSNSSLTASNPQSITVKNCALSSDGRLIAIHQEARLELHSFSKSKFNLEFLYSKCASTVSCFAFSSDGTALLLCTKDSGNVSYFHVWDIQKEVVSPRLESQGNLIAECCCLSSDKVVLCGDYEIEIWEYAEQTCRLITRLSVEKPYNSVRFSQSTLSVDNQFLVCCIADIIVVYSFCTSSIYSSKQVLRGHLGRIGFCRFLKINRYLISYAVDGMVFLWDISESKAVGFARIAEGQESIVSMAVSPEEDRAVCITSTGRVCMLKLCELGSALELKPLTAPVKVAPQKTVEASLQPLDKADSLSSSDSEEGYYLEDLDEEGYYLEDLDESDELFFEPSECSDVAKRKEYHTLNNNYLGLIALLSSNGNILSGVLQMTSSANVGKNSNGYLVCILFQKLLGKI